MSGIAPARPIGWADLALGRVWRRGLWLRWIACVFITLLVIVPRYLWWLCVGQWVEKGRPR